jgi:NitT/TauT family transport system substrate-binding protein
MKPENVIGWRPLVTVASLLLLMGLMPAGFGSRTVAATERVLMTNWIPEGTAAPVFHALEKGWFKEEGLELRIVRGYGSTRTAAVLSEGKTDFGYGDVSALIITRAKGGKIKVIGLFMDQSPVGVGALSTVPLKSPKDLEGRSVGLSPFSTNHQLMPILARINGVDYSKVRLVTVQPGLEILNLITGKFDISAMWEASSREIAIVKARQAGKKIVFMPFRNFGMDIYAMTFWTSESTIANDATNSRAFLKAVYRGFMDTGKHREAAYASLMKHHPALDKEVTRLQVDTLVDRMIDWKRWERGGPGIVDAAKMKRTVKIIREGFKLKEEVKAEDVYTNAFLQGQM